MELQAGHIKQGRSLHTTAVCLPVLSLPTTGDQIITVFVLLVTKFACSISMVVAVVPIHVLDV